MKDHLPSLETLTVHGLGRLAEPYRDLVPPIHLSTTFERAGDGSYPGGRVYSRDASPAYDEVEEVLRQLEGGAQALLFGSGMAAASAVLQALEPGARIVAPRSMYWALRKWLLDFTANWHIDLAFYDNAGESNLADLERQLVAAPTRLLWIETPANPGWEVTDIRAAAELAHRHGALVVVDSTVSTPVLTQPLELGADIVMHSATKYLNGHSDVVAAAQMHGGFGGMLSIRLAGGEGRARDFAARLQVFRRATSLGCVESLVEHRASVEGPGTLCPPDLLRLSIGIEPVADLLADLNQALE
ncbi:trans-sulfuration enzyme family protein [Propionivibrio sp.]|uniref:trans-sulfuration enzyme family protein n=1 Tax=Propionivibrio sp. TaxID=2212460 RepID=UPI003BF43184